MMSVRMRCCQSDWPRCQAHLSKSQLTGRMTSGNVTRPLPGTRRGRRFLHAKERASGNTATAKRNDMPVMKTCGGLERLGAPSGNGRAVITGGVYPRRLSSASKRSSATGFRREKSRTSSLKCSSNVPLSTG